LDNISREGEKGRKERGVEKRGQASFLAGKRKVVARTTRCPGYGLKSENGVQASSTIPG
jgi:hypothetical protein